MLGLPGAGADLHGRRKRYLVARRAVIIAEVVDHLFDAHRTRRRQPALVDEPPDVGVGGSVHVDRKRGKRTLADQQERVFVDAIVGFGVEILAVASRKVQRRLLRSHLHLRRFGKRSRLKGSCGGGCAGRS